MKEQTVKVICKNKTKKNVFQAKIIKDLRKTLKIQVSNRGYMEEKKEKVSTIWWKLWKKEQTVKIICKKKKNKKKTFFKQK